MANKYQLRRQTLRRTQVAGDYAVASSLGQNDDDRSATNLQSRVGAAPAGPVKYYIAVALMLAVWMVYAQTARHDFTVCDDNVYIYEQPEVQQGLTRPLAGPDGLFAPGTSGMLSWVRWKAFYWAFSESHAGNWHPLTWLTHMIDWQLYGDWRHEEHRYINSWPGGHHMTNMFLHAMNAVILFFALRKMTGAQWASAAVAMLFAVHPLRAESVAWAAERKDVLCGFFWMLTLYFYADYARRPSILRYLLVSGMLFLGLMSKSMIVTLPCVLLLLDFWPLNRVTGKFIPDDDEESALSQIGWLVLEKLPMLLVVLAVSYIAVIGQEKGVALNSFESLPLWMRLVNMSLAYVAYLGQSFWPSHMAPFYTHLGMIPQVEITPSTTPESAINAFLAIPEHSSLRNSMTPLVIARAIVSALFLFAVTTMTLVVSLFSRRNGWLAVGWLWFLGSLVPVIGILQVGTQARADRYTYLPMIGIAIMVVWGVRALVELQPALRKAMAPMVAGVAAVLISIAWLQASYWKTSYTLFEHAVQVTDRNFFGYNHLGIAFDKDSKDPTYTLTPKHRAEFDHYGIPYDASKQDPTLPPTYEQRRALADLSRDNFAETIKIKPDYDFGNNNLGVYYANKSDIKNAERYFVQALRCNVRYADVYNNLGVLYRLQGRLEESLNMHLHGLQVRQDKASDFCNIAQTYRDLGQNNEAVKHLNYALQIDPSFIQAHLTLAEIYLAQKQPEIAEQYLTNALMIDPNILSPWMQWAITSAAKGDKDLCAAAAAVAVKVAPKSPLTFDFLGEIAEQSKNFDEAIRNFEKAAELDPQNPRHFHAVAVIAAGKNDVAKTMQALRASLAIDPKFIPSLQTMGEILVANKQFDEALTYYNQIAQIEPTNPVHLYQLGSVYINKGDIGSAAKIANQLKKGAPGFSGGYTLAGQIDGIKKEFGSAQAELREAIRLDPKNATNFHLMGVILWEQGNRREAIEALDKAVHLSPNNPAEAAYRDRLKKDAGL